MNNGKVARVLAGREKLGLPNIKESWGNEKRKKEMTEY